MSLHGDRQRVENQIRSVLARSATAQDEVQGALARHTCVLVSTYVEVALRELVLRFIRNRSDDRVLRFCEASLRSFRDPNMEKVLQLVGRFGRDLREKLETVVRDEQKDHIDSVYGNRNQIVHRGQSEISLARVKEYFGRRPRSRTNCAGIAAGGRLNVILYGHAPSAQALFSTLLHSGAGALSPPPTSREPVRVLLEWFSDIGPQAKIDFSND